MKLRMPAEWESPKTILMAYPNRHTDWADILPEAEKQFDSIIDALIGGGDPIWLIDEGNIGAERRKAIEEKGGLVLDNIPFNDTWTRDYGPLTVETEEGTLFELDFGFNGWGLKFAADKDNLVNLNLFVQSRLPGYKNNRDYELEGGSVESDGKGTILTTSRCLCSPNRNGGRSKSQVEGILKARLGAERILWLDCGFLEGDDTDSHIDTIARLAPEDTILYVAAPEDKKDIHYEELLNMKVQLETLRTLEGNPYRLIPLPFPDPIYDEEGKRLPATYANYLVTGKNLYLPVYAHPVKDRLAEEAVSIAFPGHRVFTVDCRCLIRQHGSLHCSTMQLYR